MESSDLIAIISVIVTIIAIIYAIITRRKEVAGGVIEYSIDSVNIVTKKIKKSKLKIFYGKDEIDYLRMTTIKFINTFHRSITRGNVSNKDRFRLVFDEKSIKPDITIKANQALDVNCKNNPKAINEVFIDFQYLNTNDSFTLECLHTGKENPVILGSFIGFKMMNSKAREIKKAKLGALIKISFIIIYLLIILINMWRFQFQGEESYFFIYGIISIIIVALLIHLELSRIKLKDIDIN